MDYIPSKDAIFFNWVRVFADYVNANFASLGLTAAQNASLQGFFTTWLADYPAYITAQATAASFAQKKDTSRKTLEKCVRELTALMQANSIVTNEQRGALGITIPKSRRTLTPVPVTRPMANIDNRNRLDHIIHYFDEATPNSKAKPDGVRACEIWIKIGGAPPAGISELTYIVSDTKTPYTVHFKSEDAGKTAHYWFRWLNTRNESGPWSETVSVTISG